MDPYEGCGIGGLDGITEGVLAQRERIVFAWCRQQGPRSLSPWQAVASGRDWTSAPSLTCTGSPSGQRMRVRIAMLEMAASGPATKT